ncbi:MAG: hypothetical protein C4551_10170 [Bacillota bacterium]|jgi:hypothetical protein|nr:MAG: hypothetical protein C4551_10170 [Bacillota bacterium]
MSHLDLVIRNYGAGAARDVRIVFDPDEDHPQYPGTGTLNEAGIFNHLSFLAPHDQVLFYFGTLARITEIYGKGRVLQGTAKYTDDVGKQQTEFRIELAQFDKIAWLPPSMGHHWSEPPMRPGWGITTVELEHRLPARRIPISSDITPNTRAD